jgi:hypothetical protein
MRLAQDDEVIDTLAPDRADGGLSDLEPELEQFTVDAWRSPKRVVNAHLLDQRTEV